MTQPDRGLVDPIEDEGIARALPDGFALAPGGFAVTGLLIEAWDGAFVRVLRATPDGALGVATVPLVTNLANTTTPLAVAAVFTGPTVQIDGMGGGSLGANVLDTIAMLFGGGTLDIQVSKDGLTWFTQSTTALVAGVASFITGLRLTGIFARCVLTDGGAGSATVVLHADLRAS